MNWLPDDLKNEIYLYLPYRQFLSITDPSKLWLHRAKVDLGLPKEVIENQFFSYLGTDKDRYIVTLALHNKIIPGSEKFVSNSQIIIYAKEHNDKELAKELIHEIRNLTDLEKVDINKTLSETSWIDLLFTLKDNNLLDPYSLSFSDLAYYNSGSEVKRLFKEIDILSLGNTYDDNIRNYLPIMLGADLVTIPSDQGKAIYLAILYQNNLAVAKLLKSGYHVCKTMQLLAEILQEMDSGSFNSFMIVGALARVDNLEILQLVLKKYPKEKLDSLINDLTWHIIYGSQIFNWLTSHYDLVRYFNAHAFILKTFYDFGGINYFLQRLDSTKLKNLFMEVEQTVKSGYAICDRVLEFFKNKFLIQNEPITC